MNEGLDLLSNLINLTMIYIYFLAHSFILDFRTSLEKSAKMSVADLYNLSMFLLQCWTHSKMELLYVSSEQFQ